MFKFEGCLPVMRKAEHSLKQLGLQPTDDVIMTTSLMQWPNVVRRLTYLCLHQETIPR